MDYNPVNKHHMADFRSGNAIVMGLEGPSRSDGPQGPKAGPKRCMWYCSVPAGTRRVSI